MLGMASLPSLQLPSDCSGAIGLLGEGMILPPTAILLLSAIAGVGGVGGWIVAGRRSGEAQANTNCSVSLASWGICLRAVAGKVRSQEWLPVGMQHGARTRRDWMILLAGCPKHSCMQIGLTFSNCTPMTVVGCRQIDGVAGRRNRDDVFDDRNAN